MLRKLAYPLALLAAVWLMPVHALGLGDADVRSRLNQRFSASIPIVDAAPDDVESLSVRLASAADFERSGVDRADYLSTLTFTLDPSGRSVTVGSKQIAREPLLNFIVEARWRGGRLLREYTIFLDPPATPGAVAPAATADATTVRAEPAAPVVAPAARAPAPAAVPERASPKAAPPPAAPAAPAAPVAPVAASPAAGGASYGPVAPQETLWSIATRVRPSPAVTMDQVLLSLYDSNPTAFVGGIGGLQKGVMLVVPDAARMHSVDAETAKARVARLRSGRAELPAAKLIASKPPAAIPPRAAVAAPAPTPASAPTRPAAKAAPAAPAHPATAAGNDPASIADRLAGETPASKAVPATTAKAPAPVTTPTALAEPARPVVAPSVAPAGAVPAGSGTASSNAAGGMAASPSSPATSATPAASAPASASPSAAPASSSTAAAPATLASASTDPGKAASTPPAQGPAAASTPPASAATPAPAAAPAPVAATPPAAEGGLLDGLWIPTLAILGILLLIALLLWSRKRARDEQLPPTELTPKANLRTAASLGAAAGAAAGVALAERSAPAAPSAPSSLDTPKPLVDSASALDQPTSWSSLQTTPDHTEFDRVTQGDARPLSVALDSNDPVAEADFHLAYGLFNESASLLKTAIAKDPERAALRTKLAETWFAAGKPVEFLEAAEEMHGRIPASDWEKVATMGRQLCPDAALFRDGQPAPLEPDLDLSFGLDESAAPAPAPVSAAAPVPSPAAPAFGSAAAAPVGLIDFDFEQELAKAPVVEAPAAGKFEGLDLSDFDLGSDAPKKPEETNSIEFNLDELDLSQPAAAESSAGFGDEIGTKLDLARAYADMGDNEAAHGLLDEVLAGGSAMQKQEAEALRKRLSA